MIAKNLLRSSKATVESLLIAVTIFINIFAFNEISLAEDEYDPFKEVIALIQYRDFTQASRTMDRFKESGDFEEGQIHYLEGFLALTQEMSKAAKESFQRALKLGFKGEKIELLFTQALLETGEFSAALNFLNEKASPDTPQYFALKSRIFAGLGQEANSFEQIQLGLKSFQDSRLLVQMKLQFLLDKKLYKVADLFLRDLKNREQFFSEDDYIFVGAKLRSSNAIESATWILEEARLKYPNSNRLYMELAQVYVQAQRYLSAAAVMEKAAAKEARYYHEASELYRRAKSYMRALSLNQKVRDEKQRLKQRFIILLDMGDYNLASLMKNDLSRLGILNDNEDLVYGLAYAHFYSGDTAAAKGMLEKVTRPDLFKKSTVLRQSIEQCATREWECLL